MSSFVRTLTVGTVDTGYASRALLTIEVEWNAPGEDRFGVAVPDGALSFSGAAQRPRARDIDMGGQLQDELRHMLLEDAIAFAPGWDAAKLTRLLDAWDAYHLNHMQAGCRHQRALGWTYDEHPSEACPVCGYRYGSAWLSKGVPEDVLGFLRGLQ